MPRYAKGEIADIPVRKHCSVCSAWLLTSINFRPRVWLEDGSRPIHISSDCYSCHKKKQRSRHVPKLSEEYLRHRQDQEEFLLRGRLNAIEFRIWLQNRVQEISIGNVAASIGVSSRRIHSLISGQYYSSTAQKTYLIVNVHLSTVDRYAQALGYHWEDIYPHIANMDRDVVRSRLSKRGQRLRGKTSRKKRRSKLDTLD